MKRIALVMLLALPNCSLFQSTPEANQQREQLAQGLETAGKQANAAGAATGIPWFPLAGLLLLGGAAIVRSTAPKKEGVV